MTIQTNRPPPEREQRPVRQAEKKAEPVCRVKFSNTLPDIPFDSKFLQYPFDAKRFIFYKPTTLERNYKHEVLTEHDQGVVVNLVDKDVFNVEPGVAMDPADEKLLEEDIMTPQDSKRSRHHARSVSWLRRTEYISTEQTRFQPQTMDKVEAKVGYSIKKNFKEDTVIMDRESQVRAIEKTFEDSLLPIEKHYSKPNVHPVEVLPVYPDFDGWKYPCAQVIFDSDPAPVGRPVPAQIEEMSQAMIRGVMDESGEQFVAYFLPTEETLEKRREDVEANRTYEDDQDYEYKMAREYNWNVKNKASKGYEENYFLIVRDDGIYYNELETRVRLSKRRQKPGQAPSNTRLVVKHRVVNETEYRMQRYRERQLEPPGEEEEEEEEEELEMEQETITITRPGERNQGQSDDEDKNESDNESKKGSGDEDNKKSDNESGSEKGSRRSRSRSSSAGSRKSSRSGSANSKKSGSRSRSGSRGSQKSGSESPGSRKSKSRSRSGSKSPASNKSGSPASRKSRSRSKSGSRSRSGSAASKGSASSVGSKKSAASGSRKSRSGSPAGSKKSRSRSGSAASQRSGSRKSRSRSASAASHHSATSVDSKKSDKSGSRKSRSRSGSAASRRSATSVESKKSGRSASAESGKSSAASSRSASPAGSNKSGSGSGSDSE